MVSHNNTLRSGGRTAVTFLFDSGFSWAVIVPTALILARHTGLAIAPAYAICSFTVVIKMPDRRLHGEPAVLGQHPCRRG